MKKYFYALISLILAPHLAFAQRADTLGRLRTIGREAYGSETPLSPTAIAGNIVQVALGFVGIIFVLLILYAGFQWMTSGGNEEQITKAKKNIKSSTIGLILVLVAYAIASSITIWLAGAVSDATPVVTNTIP